MTKTASVFISLIAIVVILTNGQSILLPLVFAALLWILVREIKQFIDKSIFIKNKIPSWVKSVLITLLLTSVLVVITNVIVSSTRELSRSYDNYQSNMFVIAGQVEDLFDIDIKEFLMEQKENLNFAALFTGLLNTISSLLGNAFLILIYALFIFLEEANFIEKIKLIFKKEDQYEKVIGVMSRIEDSIAQYLGLKVLVSALTGILSYVALFFIGIEGPEFWAFLIFLLNFIPTIGSLIATLFPAVFSILQFGEFLPALWVVLIVGAVQVIVGNIIEPKLMGNSLNISSLVALLSLVFWGAIWGVTGMLLSIPITVIIVIILSQFPETQAVAILLSKDGKIK